MLQKLTIQNYAIIDSLTIDWASGVNIITGETGAGKSILLGALSLILGERADTKVLYRQGDKCIVEALFLLDKREYLSFFEKHELDFDTQTLIRREISSTGKSRAFINDTPVHLQQLKALGERLVNLHSQLETLDLVDTGFQLQLLDSLAKQTDAVDAYQQDFLRYKKLQQALNEKQQHAQRGKAELNFLQYQYQEISEAKLQVGEQERLENEQQTLSHVEDILRATLTAAGLLKDNEGAALDQLSEALTQLKGLRQIHPEIAANYQRIESLMIELKDISRELLHIADSTQPDPARLEEVNQRVNTIYRLQKKYGLNSIDELLAMQENLAQTISAIDNSDEAIASLQKEIAHTEKRLWALANTLHTSRCETATALAQQTEKLLHKVGMPNAQFDVRMTVSEQLNESGCTEVEFLFNANKGFSLQPIRKVASGGELSRLMLCIKSQQAAACNMPTLVFDEIDSGISGEVALRVGEIIRKMARHHQFICITHLPQIARTAHKHFYIYKETKLGKTTTQVRVLEDEIRVTEIAKMLGGNKVTEAAIANARELLKEN